MKKIAVILWTILLAASAFADGGTVLAQREEAGLKVTILAQPMPLRAGFTDVSILVQDAISEQPVLDAHINLSLKKLSGPSPEKSSLYCPMVDYSENVVPTQTQAHNKMLYTSLLSIPNSGRWELTNEVTSGSKKVLMTLPLDIAPPQKPIETWWPLLAMVPVAIGVYAWRAALIRARRAKQSC